MKSFSLKKLLYDILETPRVVKKWQDFEQIVADCCKLQDPNCVHNTKTDPDVLLSNGVGIEAKSTSSSGRHINLNSAAPNPNTYYVIGYYRGGKIKNVAIVCGANYDCKEIDDLRGFNTSYRDSSNRHVRYRTRIMWDICSPFDTWGLSNFIVDHLGKVAFC